MANSKSVSPLLKDFKADLHLTCRYEYVKSFEQHTTLLPNTYLVVRLDGRGFHKLCAKYGFEKPNDGRALELMNSAARSTMEGIPEVAIGYGVSDEFSFVLGRLCKLFDRRESKILTTIVSTFTSYYIHLWPSFFPDKPLSNPLPSFDGRIVQYPTVENLRDYLSWRQVDCHINNLYNTTFWAMQQKGGMSATEAEKELKGTLANQKNEILFSRFGINYNDELDMFRKGSLLYRELRTEPSKQAISTSPQPPADEETDNPTTAAPGQKKRKKAPPVSNNVVVEHTDMIKDKFWEGKPWLLS